MDLNKILEHILTDNVKVSITIDDIRLKFNLKINQTLIGTSPFLHNIRFYSFTFLSSKQYRWILSIEFSII